MLAIVVALSVGMLPAAGGFAAISKAMSKTINMSASEVMPDCEHHRHAPIDETQKRTNDCASMTGCALKCFNFTGATFSGIAFSPPAGIALDRNRASDDIPQPMDGLPFRPPRA